jgi:catechol 2,3-dioxygenase
MNMEITVHPKLQHYGLTTANLDAMVEWYRKVLGLKVNHRSDVPEGAQRRAPFSAVAFTSNDEVHHRVVFFEVPGVGADPDKGHHARVQHVAFEYQELDDLLGTYVRLKGLGILPVFAFDEGFQAAFYYQDRDRNLIELNVNYYGNDWTATEHMLASAPLAQRPEIVPVDPEKMITARKAGASAWEVHKKAFAGEFPPANPYQWHGSF